MTSKLEELIAKLCPNGVEYKKIGDVADYEQPTKYIVKSTKYNNSFATPVLTAGQSFILGYTDELDNIYLASKDDPVIIFDDFTGAIQWVDFPFKVKSSAMKMITAKPNVLIRYLYHWMSLLGFSSSEHKRLWIGTYSNFEIPVPPLEVQEEIVRILDTFTELTAELTAELTSRKKQYEYYRDALLTFDDNNPLHSLISRYCPNGVEYKNLKELGSFFGGLTGKNKNDFVDGNARYITYKNVYCNAAVDFSANDFVKVSDGEKQNVLQYGDVIFTGSSETPDECGFSSAVTCHLNEEVYLNSFCFAFRFNDVSVMNPYFSKYLFRSTALRSQIKRTANGVTRFNVSKALMSKVTIPVPPLDVQRQIVQILDRFDALCNDLTQGLPAEIEARRKQYEYYRDQLLNFKRA